MSSFIGAALGAALLAGVLQPSPAAPASPSAPAQIAAARARLDAAKRELVTHFAAVEERTHAAVIFETRLDEDYGGLSWSPPPDIMSAQEYAEAVTLETMMDAALVDQLSTGDLHDLAAVRGADEVLIPSPADGLLQPAAVYVPPSYTPGRHPPLVVLLHGRTQSEIDIIAGKWFRQLADQSGAIIVAPFGRGDTQYADPAGADVYATLEAARRAFDPDPRRTFLAGYSMGGYGVYGIGVQRAQEWAGFLAVAGGPTNENQRAVYENFAGKPVYIVSGVKDDVIPNSYIRFTAQQLRQAGIPASYYEQPDGTHSLRTVFPALARAWSDMLAGVVQHSVVPPGSLPSGPVHPD